MRDTSFDILSIPSHTYFFEQAKFKRLFSDNVFQIAGFTTKSLNLASIGLTHRVTSQTLVPNLHEFLRSRIIVALHNTFLPIQLNNRILFTRSSQKPVFFSNEYRLRCLQWMSFTVQSTASR
jgi:hypothetical protein